MYTLLPRQVLGKAPRRNRPYEGDYYHLVVSGSKMLLGYLTTSFTPSLAFSPLVFQLSLTPRVSLSSLGSQGRKLAKAA